MTHNTFAEKLANFKILSTKETTKTQACVACKNYFFSWLVEMGHFVFLMFSQLSKERKYRITSLQEKEKKHYLFKLTYLFYGLLSNYFCTKIKCIVATLTVVSFSAVVWSRHISIPRWIESHCVTRPNNGCERDYAYSRSFNRKKIKIILLQ